MKVESFSSNPSINANPPFGRINQYWGTSHLLKRILKPAEMDEFQKLLEKQANNTVDINFYTRGEENDKLKATILPDLSIMHVKFLKQGFFESHMKFVRRCCAQADEYKRIADNVRLRNKEQGFTLP